MSETCFQFQTQLVHISLIPFFSRLTPAIDRAFTYVMLENYFKRSFMKFLLIGFFVIFSFLNAAMANEVYTFANGTKILWKPHPSLPSTKISVEDFVYKTSAYEIRIPANSMFYIYDDGTFRTYAYTENGLGDKDLENTIYFNKKPYRMIAWYGTDLTVVHAAIQGERPLVALPQIGSHQLVRVSLSAKNEIDWVKLYGNDGDYQCSMANFNNINICLRHATFGTNSQGKRYLKEIHVMNDVLYPCANGKFYQFPGGYYSIKLNEKGLIINDNNCNM